MRHATIHENHLGAFGHFLEKCGATLAAPKGNYEVLRALYVADPPTIVYRRDRGQVLTVSKGGAQDVEDFYRQMKGEAGMGRDRVGTEKMKIYVASSWKNEDQPLVVETLRGKGHEVYDFRHPKVGDGGFSWTKLEDDMGKADFWAPADWLKALDHPSARDGFRQDMEALEWCDTVLLILPCGRSAHLELGYGVGTGKRTAVYFPSNDEWPDPEPRPELMYKMVHDIIMGSERLESWANGPRHVRNLSVPKEMIEPFDTRALAHCRSSFTPEQLGISEGQKS